MQIESRRKTQSDSGGAEKTQKQTEIPISARGCVKTSVTGCHSAAEISTQTTDERINNRHPVETVLTRTKTCVAVFGVRALWTVDARSLAEHVESVWKALVPIIHGHVRKPPADYWHSVLTEQTAEKI